MLVPAGFLVQAVIPGVRAALRPRGTGVARRVAKGLGVDIESPYWDGCPSHPEARGAARRGASPLRGIDAEIRMTHVGTDAEAGEASLSPARRSGIDGRDVDAGGAAAPPSLTCRIYHLADGGRPSLIPSREELRPH